MFRERFFFIASFVPSVVIDDFGIACVQCCVPCDVWWIWFEKKFQIAHTFCKNWKFINYLSVENIAHELPKETNEIITWRLHQFAKDGCWFLKNSFNE